MLSSLKGRHKHCGVSSHTLKGCTGAKAWVLILSGRPGTYFQFFAEPVDAERHFWFLWACVHIHASLCRCIKILLHGKSHFLNQVRRLMSLHMEYVYCMFWGSTWTAVNFCFQTLCSILDKSEELHVSEELLLRPAAAVLLASACLTSLPFSGWCLEETVCFFFSFGLWLSTKIWRVLGAGARWWDGWGMSYFPFRLSLVTSSSGILPDLL